MEQGQGLTLRKLEDYGKQLLNIGFSVEDLERFLVLFQKRSELFAEFVTSEPTVRTEDGHLADRMRVTDEPDQELIRCIMDQNEVIKGLMGSYAEWLEQQVQRSDEALKLSRLYHDYARSAIKLSPQGHNLDKSL